MIIHYPFPIRPGQKLGEAIMEAQAIAAFNREIDGYSIVCGSCTRPIDDKSPLPGPGENMCRSCLRKKP